LSGFHEPTPHHIPVGIVAPARVARQIDGNLSAHIPGGFDLRPLGSEQRARAEIERRQIDGALVVSPGGLRLLTAEAGGTASAQAITNAFAALAATPRRPLATTDVVPPLRHDSQALSSFFLIMCVLFPSLATGVAAGHVLRRSGLVSRIAVLVAIAGVAGLASAGIADGISGLGNYWALAGIVALFSLAISAPTAALGQIKAHLGALCVLAFLIFGIPVSGGPPNLAGFVPSFLRSLHSGLPLGAAADTIRNVVYFHASDTTGHLWVLTAYAAGGLAVMALLVTVTRRRHQGHSADARAATPPRARETLPGQVLAGVGSVVLRHYGLRLTEPQPRLKRPTVIPCRPPAGYDTSSTRTSTAR
jgi:hypothetical protein